MCALKNHKDRGEKIVNGLGRCPAHVTNSKYIEILIFDVVRTCFLFKVCYRTDLYGFDESGAPRGLSGAEALYLLILFRTQ